jgi:galactonate dehydratase
VSPVFKSGIPGYYEWIETNASIKRAVGAMQMLREGLGPDIDIGVDFHAKTSPSVASIIIKEVEPLNLLFVEEPCLPKTSKPWRELPTLDNAHCYRGAPDRLLFRVAS